MGFPTIIYLSKAKIENLLHTNKKNIITPSSVKSGVTLSFNPEIKVEAEFKKSDNSAPHNFSGFEWPPTNAFEIAANIEKELKKNNQIGTIQDLKNKDYSYLCYKLKGKLFLDDDKHELSFIPFIKSNGINGTLKLDEYSFRVYLSFENISGMVFYGDQWRTRNSIAYHLFETATYDGFSCIGLFTLESNPEDTEIKCGILYFANDIPKESINKKHLKIFDIDKANIITIYNDYQ